MLDITEALCKFYGNYNNITSIIDKQSNEMVAVYLAKTHCLRVLIYGCEVWDISQSTSSAVPYTERMWHGRRASDTFFGGFIEKA